MRMRNPVHPGHFLRTEIVAAHGLTVTEAANILRVSRSATTVYTLMTDWAAVVKR